MKAFGWAGSATFSLGGVRVHETIGFSFMISWLSFRVAVAAFLNRCLFCFVVVVFLGFLIAGSPKSTDYFPFFCCCGLTRCLLDGEQPLSSYDASESLLRLPLWIVVKLNAVSLVLLSRCSFDWKISS